MFKFFNSLTAPRHAIKIALSFTAEKDLPEKNLFIVPPLIRSSIVNRKPEISDYILVYLLNGGYRKKIIDWSLANPKVNIEAFTNSSETEAYRPDSHLKWHMLSGQKFIDRLAACQAYVSTAGFDSIAEAAFLEKNILMVPTKNHFEQKCNAIDARRAGLAVSADDFDLSLVTNNKKTHSDRSIKTYKEWVERSSDKIINILERYSII